MYDIFHVKIVVTYNSNASNISTASSYPLTNKSTSIFFNCEKMTISLFKYHWALREDRTIVSTYEKFSDELLE